MGRFLWKNKLIRYYKYVYKKIKVQNIVYNFIALFNEF